MIFVHLLVNDNQLYNDARWIQREIPNICQLTYSVSLFFPKVTINSANFSRLNEINLTRLEHRILV
jgi:hypothetical protein